MNNDEDFVDHYDGHLEKALDTAILISRAEVDECTIRKWRTYRDSENAAVRLVYQFCYIVMNFDLLSLKRGDARMLAEKISKFLFNLKESTFTEFDANLLATIIMRRSIEYVETRDITLEARRNYGVGDLPLNFKLTHRKILEIARNLDAALNEYLLKHPEQAPTGATGGKDTTR